MKIKSYIENHPIIKTGANYSFWASLKSLCTTIVGLTIMFWLSPFELGQWNAVSIFLAYTPFLQLGIQSGLNIELPIQLGKNRPEKAETLVANGYGYAILISLIIAVLGILFSIIYYFKSGVTISAGVLTITIVAICSSFQLHLIARFRSSKAFDRLTKIYMIEIPVIIFTVFLIYRYHYWGILMYNIIISAVDVFLLFKFTPFAKVKPYIRKPIILRMGKIGIALMVLVQLRTAAQTLPRWIIITKAGMEKLGLYTPATAINNLIGLIPGQIAQFFHPQMGYIYGQTGQASSMWPYVKKMVILLPLAAIPVAVCIWFLSPWLLDTFFPKYMESLWPMRIMAITFVFVSSITTSWLLNTLKAFKYSYLFSICDFAGSFIYPYVMTCILPYNVLLSVTIGLAINGMMSYFLNILILRHVLNMPKYNPKIK